MESDDFHKAVELSTSLSPGYSLGIHQEGAYFPPKNAGTLKLNPASAVAAWYVESHARLTSHSLTWVAFPA